MEKVTLPTEASAVNLIFSLDTQEPDPPKKKNKVLVQKMVIADPGMGIEIAFENWEESMLLKEIDFSFNFYSKEGATQPQYLLQWTIDGFSEIPGGNTYIDVYSSPSYIFIFPFADKDFNDHEEFFFDVGVTFSFNGNHPSEKLPNPKQKITIHKNKTIKLEESLNPVSPNPDPVPESVTLSNIILLEEGVCFDALSPVNPPDEKRASKFYLQPTDNTEILSIPYPHISSGGTRKIDDSAFIPFIKTVKVIDGEKSSNPTEARKHKIKVAIGKGANPPQTTIIDFEDQNIEPYGGNVNFSLQDDEPLA